MAEKYKTYLTMIKKLSNHPNLFLSCGAAILILLFTGLIGLFLAYMAPDATRNYERESNYEARYYTIDPSTILELVDQGKINLFTLQTATPEAPRPLTSDPVSWKQEDYLRIANALFQYSWGEPFQTMNLYYMIFSLNCADIEQGGFNQAQLKSYKVIRTGQEETRVEVDTLIIPSQHLASTLKGEYTPDKKRYKPIDLSLYQISAEEALQIAELNGGAEKRLEHDNKCRISAITTGDRGNGWEIAYSHKRDDLWWADFVIFIDPKTGEFEVDH